MLRKKPKKRKNKKTPNKRSNRLDTSDNKHCDYDVNVPISDIG